MFCNVILPYEKYRIYKSSKQDVSNSKGQLLGFGTCSGKRNFSEPAFK